MRELANGFRGTSAATASSVCAGSLEGWSQAAFSEKDVIVFMDLCDASLLHLLLELAGRPDATVRRPILGAACTSCALSIGRNLKLEQARPHEGSEQEPWRQRCLAAQLPALQAITGYNF